MKSRTKKVQVTLDEVEYRELARIAERDGRKMAAVVRESIEKYCLEPEREREKREALEQLGSVSLPVEEDYEAWEREYGSLKTESAAPSEDERCP